MLNNIKKFKAFLTKIFLMKNSRRLSLTIFPKNFKGGEKLLSIFWFSVLAIVGIGITAAVLIYHSADVDVREMEINILYEKIINCVIEHGFLIEGLIEEDFDIFNECQLNKETFGEGSYFYFNLKVFDSSSNLIKEIEEGDFSFEKDCEVQEGEGGVSARYYPKCIRKKEIVLYYKNNKIEEAEIEILTASNQVGRKVSVIK
jgi:hypothetical protein